jgi:hypothetical protein
MFGILGIYETQVFGFFCGSQFVLIWFVVPRTSD